MIYPKGSTGGCGSCGGCRQSMECYEVRRDIRQPSQVSIHVKDCKLGVQTPYGADSVSIDDIARCIKDQTLSLSEDGKKLCVTSHNGKKSCVSVCEMLAETSIGCLKDVDAKCPPECTSLFGWREGKYGPLKAEHISALGEDEKYEIDFSELVMTAEGCIKKRETETTCEPETLNTEIPIDCSKEVDGGYTGPADEVVGAKGRLEMLDCTFTNPVECPVDLELKINYDFCLTLDPGDFDAEMYIGIAASGGTIVGLPKTEWAGKEYYLMKVQHRPGEASNNPGFLSATGRETFDVENVSGTLSYQVAYLYKDNKGNVTGYAASSGFSENGVDNFPVAGNVKITNVRSI